MPSHLVLRSIENDVHFSAEQPLKEHEIFIKPSHTPPLIYSCCCTLSCRHITYSMHQSLELLKEKKKRKFLRESGASPPPPREILKVETKTCAIWGILETNLKKSSTLKFMMNINFVPSICIHRSIILIFIEKKSVLVDFFPRKRIFPRCSIFTSVWILFSVANSRLWYTVLFYPPHIPALMYNLLW